METQLKEIRDYLYGLEWNFEDSTTNNADLQFQGIQVYQRIQALLNIYQQIVEKGRLFDDVYLEKYLGR